MFLLIRRVAFTIVVFCMADLLVFQLLTLIGCAMTNAVYHLALWPQEKNRDNKLEVYNEITILLLLYHLMCFSDMVPQHQIRYSIGYSYIVCACTDICLHLVLILRENIKVIRLKIKKKIFEKKRAKKSLMTEYKKEVTKIEMSRELGSEPEHEDDLVIQEPRFKIKLEP